jgi:gluconolactonase
MKRLFLIQFLALFTAAQNATVSIPSLYAYNLPNPVQGNITQDFVDTPVNDPTISALLSKAQSAPFIAYDPEFISILGTNASLQLAAQRPNAFAEEAGVWVPNRNEVWFTGEQAANGASVYVLSLSDNTVYTPNTSIPIPQANGGYYFNGTVYITSAGNGNTTAPGIYAINPDTKETSLVINSYFGVPLNGPDDMTWVKKGNRTYMYFTDPPLSQFYAGGPPAQLPDTTWRFSPDDGSIVPAVSRGDVLVPNGIRVNAEQTKVFITDTPEVIPGVSNAVGSWASNAIYIYDIDEYGFLGNKRMFGLTRNGISDGIHIDDAGRVWTAETEGVVVRNVRGKVIGLFNNQAITGNATLVIENFALAGDTLVILDRQIIWTLKLAETVITAERCNEVGC